MVANITCKNASTRFTTLYVNVSVLIKKPHHWNTDERDIHKNVIFGDFHIPHPIIDKNKTP
jgi:hypothetical protein